jgi:hypothetical protein
VSEPSADAAHEVDKDIAAQIAQLQLQAPGEGTDSAKSTPAKPAAISASESNAKVAAIASVNAAMSVSSSANMKASAAYDDELAIDTQEARANDMAMANSFVSQLPISAPVSPQRQQQENDEAIDAFATFNTPREPLEQGTPPSLRMIRRRILHSRHGAEYQDTDAAPDQRSRSVSPQPHSQPLQSQLAAVETNPPVANPPPRVLIQQEAAIAPAQPMVRERRRDIHTWEDYGLIISIGFVSFVLGLLLIRKFKRLLEGYPFDINEL